MAIHSSRRLDKVQPGDPITAEAYNHLIDLVDNLQQTVIQLQEEVSAVPRLYLGDLDEDVESGNTGKKANILHYESGWADSGRDIERVADGTDGIWLQYERHIFYAFTPDGKQIPIPFPQLQLGELSSQLVQDGSATCKVFEGNPASTGTYTDSGKTVTVHDWLLDTGQTIESGKRVIFFQHGSSRDHIVLGAQCAS
jgi:hypothetical protein